MLSTLLQRLHDVLCTGSIIFIFDIKRGAEV